MGVHFAVSLIQRCYVPVRFGLVPTGVLAVRCSADPLKFVCGAGPLVKVRVRYGVALLRFG